MNKFKEKLKKNWWPISAMIFCPCHLPLSMGIIVFLTAGTTVGTYLSQNYSAIESVLAVTFSFYFVIAFMIWAVRGPQMAEGQVCIVDENGRQQVEGLTTKQIVMWGILGMFTMPLLISASLLVRNDILGDVITTMRSIDVANSGMIWLISISTIVMIPVMIIWIAWMWITWTRVDHNTAETAEDWQYEYE